MPQPGSAAPRPQESPGQRPGGWLEVLRRPDGPAWPGAMRRRLVAGERQLPLMVLLIGLSITAVVTEQNRSLNQQAHERI